MWVSSSAIEASRLLQVRHREADQQRVVATKAAPQRLAKLGELGPQPPLGQLGQDPRVALAIDQGRQHRPPRDPKHVSSHRVQLDAGVFQGLLDPLASEACAWISRLR